MVSRGARSGATLGRRSRILAIGGSPLGRETPFSSTYDATADCRLPTARLPDCPTARLPTAHCPLPTAHCPLPTALNPTLAVVF